MRFALYAVVAAGIASSVYAEASAEDNLVERGISFGTIKIPLPIGKAPAPAPKPAPKPAPAPIVRPGTIALPLPIHFKRDELEERASIIRSGTLAIPLPVGKPGGAPAPAPKPAPAPIKPPGTLKIWLRNLVGRGISFGTIKIPLPVFPKAPAPAPKPAPKPAPVPIKLPGTIALPIPIHFKRDDLEERASIIRPGTLAIPLPVGKPAPAPAKPAPKPAPAPIKPPGTLRIWLRSIVARGFSIGSLKIPLPIGKAPAPAPKPAPKPAPAPIIRPGTIALPLPIHFKRALASCTEKQIACPVPGLLHGFDCVDIATDVQQCGDCQALGGVDCTRIPGAGGVSCRNGYCHVESCVEGWAYDFRKRSCVQAPKFWTQ
ncbi:hypothetical protein JCM16303_004231 [Sporobolomyces ruberrimus]